MDLILGGLGIIGVGVYFTLTVSYHVWQWACREFKKGFDEGCLERDALDAVAKSLEESRRARLAALSTRSKDAASGLTVVEDDGKGRLAEW